MSSFSEFSLDNNKVPPVIPKIDKQRVRILIIDDEHRILRMMKKVLNEEGYRITTALSSEEALNLINEKFYDIIFADLKMPKMDGIELLKEVKKISPDSEYIIITGFATIETVIESMKLGAADYITKPFSLKQISLLVEKTLERKNLYLAAQEVEFYKRLSRLDGLTELFNHRFFHQILDSEISRAKRFGHSVSLIMLDIDFFKIYNDTNGHPAGDLALKRLAWILVKSCRQYDFVCRYGGEEFAVICPETELRKSKVIASRIRHAVELAKFENEDILPFNTLTISLGLAIFPEDAKSKTELIENADKALYMAKTTGRNKVITFLDYFHSNNSSETISKHGF